MKIGFMSCYETQTHKNFKKFAFESGQSLLEYDLVLWDMAYLHFGYRLSVYSPEKELRRLLRDRKRRLNEIEEILRQGKTLVILCPFPTSFKMDNLEGSECQSLLEAEGFADKSLDIYSFLPSSLAQPVRENAIDANGNKMDFRGDAAFLSTWEVLKGVAWYSVYFQSPIGTPFLFVHDTPYPTATWFKYDGGSIVFIPATKYDDAEDYSIFVEAGTRLIEALKELANKTVEQKWEDEETPEEPSQKYYVHPSRIRELQSIASVGFDLAKLVQLCKELNISYQSKGYFATIMLIRSILDHVPPIFGYRYFAEVANNYKGGKSFSEVMLRLENTSRKIADLHLHQQIRSSEVLPNRTQVDFSNELDVLLAELVRLLRTNT